MVFRKTRKALVPLMSVVMLLAIVFGFGIKQAYADKIIYMNGEEGDIGSVYQGEDGDTFAVDAPAVNIYIITSMVDDAEDANNAIVNLNKKAEEDGFGIGARTAEEQEHNKLLYFDSYDEDNSVSRLTKQENVFEYDEPIVTYTFKNAAHLGDDTYGDVVVEYNRVTLIPAIPDANYGDVYLGDGNGFHGNAIAPPGGTRRMGILIDVNIHVVKGKDIYKGAFYLPATGLTVNRYTNARWQNEFGYGEENGYDHYFIFSEAIIVRDGYLTNKNKHSFFIPGGETIRQGTTDSKVYYTAYIEELGENHKAGKGVYFGSHIGVSAGNTSLYCGFVTVADNTSGGINFTYIMGSGVSLPVNNAILYGYDTQGEPLWYQIKATTGKGGKVETTEEGNVEGDLSDGSKVYDSDKDSVLSVTEGKDITYKLTPKPGYKLKSVKANLGNLDIDAEGTIEVEPEMHTDKHGSVYYTYSFNAIAEDNSLHVEWDPCNYKINYDANGGSGEMTSQDFTGDDETMVSKENEFTREGHLFEGFKVLDKDGNPILDEEGNEIIITDAKDLKDILLTQGDNGEITLQAQWKLTTYKLNYDANGGTGEMESQEFNGVDDKMESKTNEFTKEGYEFKGFKVLDKDGNPLKDADGNEITVKDTMDFKDILVDMGDGSELTLQAQWELIPTIWVTYVDPDGVTVYLEKTTIVVGEEEPPAPEDPTKEGYRFVGWEYSVDDDGNITHTAIWEEVIPEVPETGDNRSLLGMTGMLLMSVIMLAGTVLYRRKQSD